MSNTVSIIRLDGAAVGLAPAPGNDQGLGVLNWFHLNAGGQSMAYYLEHGGYSVDEPAELDCGDVEDIINAICARSGVTMDATFVPFSQSRNAKPRNGSEPWKSLNWTVAIKRRGRSILTTDYAQGVGHTPAGKKTAAQIATAARVMGRTDKAAKQAMIEHEIETGKKARGFSSLGLSSDGPIPAPSIGDVMQSLALDASVIDAGGFEAWASELGYDTDSRAAEANYRECLAIATAIIPGLGAELFAEIRLAASFN